MVDAFVDPGECFTLVSTRDGDHSFAHVASDGKYWRGGRENGIIEGPRVTLHHEDNDKGWSWNKHAGSSSHRFGRVIGDVDKENTYFLLKIINDSIIQGTKHGLDVEDYEIVDVVGKR